MQYRPWTVIYQVRRQKGQEPSYVEQFTLQVDPDEYVLDGIERIWAFHDRSLTFRHACHHSTCGACGMRVNGVEKLTCITRIRDVTHDARVIAVEPLRNFPVVGDLVVDVGRLYAAMEHVNAQSVLPDTDGSSLRLSDCIECGLCVSACPVMATALSYLGPAALSATQPRALDGDAALLDRIDGADGLWRCHNSFECSAVCPSGVDPARQIMGLRRRVVGWRVKQLFARGKEQSR